MRKRRGFRPRRSACWTRRYAASLPAAGRNSGLVGRWIGIGLRAGFERPSNRKRVDQVVFLSLFAGEVRLIVPAAAAAIDRLVGIHADLASARNRDRSRLRRADIVGRYTILDPVHESSEQRFPIDLRSAYAG